jgi:anti-sigma regulatory factor (Ser/Thr protein kinase)
MFYGVLDPRSGRLTFASAGHSPLLVWRRGTGAVETHRATGIPLGAVRGGAIARTLRDDEVTLGPGDLLVQFTDGVNEAFEPTGTEQFGMERLERLVAGGAPDGPRALIERVHTAIDAWVSGGPALDDETLLVVAALDGTTPAGRDPLELLEEARERGAKLELPATLDDLAALDGWMTAARWANGLTRDRYEVLRTSLHEALANIVEHGYGESAVRGGATTVHRIELWCVTAATGAPEYFVIRDHGRPFAAGSWRATDFADPRVWKRGRGFGLDIIHRAMRAVRYHPETTEGNVTVLTFDPPLEQERHDG